MAASPGPSKKMSKAQGRKRRSQIVDSDDDDDERSEEEPIVQPRSRRARRSGAAARAVEEENEEEEDAADVNNVKVERHKAVGKRSARRSYDSEEEKEPAEQPKRRGKEQQSTAKRRTGEPGASGKDQAAAEAAPEMSEEDGDETHLDQMSNFYEMNAVDTEANGPSVSLGEENRLVRSMMRYVLFRQRQKPGQPIKRDELTKLVLTNYKNQKVNKLVTFIIKKAAARFASTFGMELKEVTLKTQTRQGEVEGAKVFVLRSLLSDKLRSFVKSPGTELSQALTMVILPLIALHGGKLTERELWDQLAKLGLKPTTQHPVLGKPADQIQLLLQKKYLAEGKENGPDGTYKCYTISSAVMDEIQEDRLTAYIDSVFSHSPATQLA